MTSIHPAPNPTGHAGGISQTARSPAKVSRQKRLGFMSVLIVVIFLVAFGAFFVTGHVKQMASNLSGATLTRIGYMGSANDRLADGFIQTILAVHSSTDAERRSHLEKIPAITASMNEYLDKLDALPLEESQRVLLEKFKFTRAEYSEARKECFVLLQKNPEQASNFLAQKLLPKYTLYDQAGAELWNGNILDAKAESYRILHTASQAQIWITACVFLAVIIGFGAGLYRIVSSLEW